MKPEVVAAAESTRVVAERTPVVAVSGLEEVGRTLVAAENVPEGVVERRPVEAESEPVAEVIVPASLDAVGNNGEPVVALS